MFQSPLGFSGSCDAAGGRHLADAAVEAAPEDDDVCAAAHRVYAARAESEDSLMATNLYNSAAAYAAENRPFR